MGSDISTSSAVHDGDGYADRLKRWLLLEGNRVIVAGGVLLGIFSLVTTLIFQGIITVGPGSSAATLFASGLTSGTLTLVTVALSINQLILSRVFGSPNELTQKLDGTLELRRTVENLADRPSSPNDPAGFLSLIATTLTDRARRLRTAIDESSWDATADFEAYLADIVGYGESIDAGIEDEAAIVDVLAIILGTEYARNLTATRHVGNKYGEHLTDAARDELDAIQDLLEAIAVARQFFKTIALQQDFAKLSRIIAYSGLFALVATLSLALIYRTNTITIDPQYLGLVVGLGLTVIVTPLAVLIAYILRAATIALRTVSVGPFVPSKERSGGS